MENASKALIIAGAILLTIMLIALGMRIFNNASSSTGNPDLSTQEIAAHNSQFEIYNGEVKGTQVMSLITKIQQNNANYEDRKVSISFSNYISSDGISPRGPASSYKSASPTFECIYTGKYNTSDAKMYTTTGQTSGGATSVVMKDKDGNETGNVNLAMLNDDIYNSLKSQVKPKATYHVETHYWKNSGLIYLVMIWLAS